MLLLAATACASADPGSDDASATWVGTITTDGNVTTVINESGSVWGGTARFVEEASIGVDVGANEYMLASIRSIAASDDRIYLLEQRPPTVRVYDMAGRHLMDVGTEGQGPGELTRPMSLGIRPDGMLLVRDDGNARVNVFSPAGTLVDDWALPGGFMTSFQMVIIPDGTVYTYLPIRDGADGPRRHGMIPFSSDGTQQGEPIPLPELDFERMSLGEISGTTNSGSRITTSLSVPFAPASRSTMSPSAAMVVGVNSEYKFEVRRFDGTTMMVERRIEPVPVQPAEAEWHRLFTIARARNIDPAWSWSGPDIPAQKPFYSAFYPDHSGRIWVRRSGLGRHLEDCDEDPQPGPIRGIVRCWEDTPITDVFGSDGRFLGDVEFPEGTRLDSRVAFIRDDMALLRLEDEAGTIMVKRYRLVLPGEE